MYKNSTAKWIAINKPDLIADLIKAIPKANNYRNWYDYLDEYVSQPLEGRRIQMSNDATLVHNLGKWVLHIDTDEPIRMAQLSRRGIVLQRDLNTLEHYIQR